MKKIASAVLAAFLSTALAGAYAAGEPHKPAASAAAKSAQKAKPRAHRHTIKKAPHKPVRHAKRTAKRHVKKAHVHAHRHPVKRAATVHRDPR